MNIAKISSPIRGENSLLNEAVEAAVRPIGYAIDVAMFHRVEVDVIDVSLEILIISNRVLPVSALPDSFLTLGDLAR